MRIIIEGADLTGKSTLAKRLAKDFDLSYVHVIRKDLHTKDFYMNLLDKYDVIFDRHFIGESIYPILFKRPPKFGEDGFNEILNKARELNYVIIVTYATHEQLIDRIKQRPNEPNDVIETIEKANEMFIDKAVKYGFILINTETTPYHRILDMIKAIQEAWGEAKCTDSM